jgi:hypothetical protein
MTDIQQNAQAIPAAPDALDSVIAEGISRIQSVYQLVPEFQPAPLAGSASTQAARSVSNEFLEASAVAVERDATLKSTTGLDPATARLVISRNLRFEALAAAAEALARDIRFNMQRERWDVVQEALQVYALAKGFARRPRGGSLVAHVRTMRGALRRGPGKTRVQPPAPPPATT